MSSENCPYCGREKDELDKKCEVCTKNHDDFKKSLDVQLEQIKEFVLDSMEDGIMRREWAPLDAIVTALRMSGAIK